MIYIGIDPGLDGAVAAMITDESHRIDLNVTPTIAGKASKREYDIAGMVRLLEPFVFPDCFVTIERSQAMPGQGVTSMFSIGKGYGIWLGIINALGLRHQIVAPVTWSKALCKDVAGDTKQRNLIVCQRLFPNVNLLATERSRKPHEGIVDALLIAEYGRRTNAL